MSKKYRLLNRKNPIVYTVLWEDAKGALLELENIRYWYYADVIKTQFVEYAPEKWLVLKEWSDGKYSVTGKNHAQNKDLAFPTEQAARDWVDYEQMLLSSPNTDFYLGKYVFKVIKVA